MDIIAKSSIEHKKLTTSAEIVSYRLTGLKRYETYTKIKTKGGFKGIPTPYPTLYKNIQGFVDGTMMVVAAMANTGKAQPVTTVIPTPDGMRQFRDLVLGLS